MVICKSKNVDVDLQEQMSKINDFVDQKKTGKAILYGPREGILARALGSSEPFGHVRGIGGHINSTTFFHRPTVKIAEKERFMKVENELNETKMLNSKLNERLEKLDELMFKGSRIVGSEDKGSCSVKMYNQIYDDDVNSESDEDDVKEISDGEPSKKPNIKKSLQ